MIDVVEALEILEKCADEIDSEELSGGEQEAPLRASNLAGRALAECGLRLADLSSFSRVRAANTARQPRVEPALTLGALIAFRTAARFARAGASPARTVNASYRAVTRYIEILPIGLRDGADSRAVQVGLIGQPTHPILSQRPATRRSQVRRGYPPCDGTAGR
ncbi:MAG: hypothetical protein JWO63_643 [Frankiales bacterium]|jgi:hypothetical protein|nr:hypothetical protein [Frankiales bacterium]